jgi:hypothetical protein
VQLMMPKTPFWGDKPDSRPMFLVPATPKDPVRGRASARSGFTELVVSIRKTAPVLVSRAALFATIDRASRK